MRHRILHNLASLIGIGERTGRRFNFQRDSLANKLQPRIAHQGAGQQAGFGQNLKPVTHPKRITAAFDMTNNSFANRRAGRNRATAQIVTKGKPARDRHQIQPLRQVGVLVPHHLHVRTGRL